VFRIDVFENLQDGRRRQTATRVIDRLWLDPAQAQEVKEIKARLWPPIAEMAPPEEPTDEEPR
jgi:hypothetical protein